MAHLEPFPDFRSFRMQTLRRKTSPDLEGVAYFGCGESCEKNFTFVCGRHIGWHCERVFLSCQTVALVGVASSQCPQALPLFAPEACCWSGLRHVSFPGSPISCHSLCSVASPRRPFPWVCLCLPPTLVTVEILLKKPWVSI